MPQPFIGVTFRLNEKSVMEHTVDSRENIKSLEQSISQFKNSDVDLILNGEECNNKKMLIEFFRGITLCHQANVTRDIQSDKYNFTGVHNDELFTLDFCQQFDFTLVSRKKKVMQLMLRGKMEKYEELGIVTTKAVMGHFMTICAVRT